MNVHKSLTAIQERIDQLEEAGYHILLQHARYKHYRPHPGNDLPVIGHTTMVISREDGIAGMGTTYCSIHDQFDRVKGTQRAFTRAVHDLSKVISRASVIAIFS